MLFRHAKETAALTAEADAAKSRSEQLEMENGKLGARLASALADYEQSVKEKLVEVTALQAQIHSARREASGVETGKEVERLRGEVRSTVRQLEEEREGRRRAELRSEQLRADLGGMEALVNNGNTGEDDSMVQLGLSGATEAAGAGSTSLRIREELHRSLVSSQGSILTGLIFVIVRWEIEQRGRRFPNWSLLATGWKTI